jgi:hypothetical protein
MILWFIGKWSVVIYNESEGLKVSIYAAVRPEGGQEYLKKLAV